MKNFRGFVTLILVVSESALAEAGQANEAEKVQLPLRITAVEVSAPVYSKYLTDEGPEKFEFAQASVTNLMTVRVRSAFTWPEALVIYAPTRIPYGSTEFLVAKTYTWYWLNLTLDPEWLPPPGATVYAFL